MNWQQYTDEEKLKFVDYFRNNAGDVSRACKAFKIARKTFYNWYNTIPDFKDAVDEVREELKDFGESQLMLLMKGIPETDKNNKLTGWKVKPDVAAVIFFNKTKNKDRGYSERDDGGFTRPTAISVVVDSQATADEFNAIVNGEDIQKPKEDNDRTAETD